MSHQVLQGLWVHTSLCHIAAIGVAAYMRGDLRQRDLKQTVIFFQCMLEVLLPVHANHRHTILVYVQESAVTVNHWFDFSFFPFFQDRLKTLVNILGHGKLPRTSVCFSALDSILHVGPTDQLVVDVNFPFSQIDVLHSQSTEFRNTHASME